MKALPVSTRTSPSSVLTAETLANDGTKPTPSATSAMPAEGRSGWSSVVVTSTVPQSLGDVQDVEVVGRLGVGHRSAVGRFAGRTVPDGPGPEWEVIRAASRPASRMARFTCFSASGRCLATARLPEADAVPAARPARRAAVPVGDAAVALGVRGRGRGRRHRW